jgi:hypothetical protein
MTNPADYLFNLAVQWAKSNNTYYEKIALDMNKSNNLGYNIGNIDVLKHTIGASDGTLNDGAFWTSTLGYGNEIYSASKGRDGYNEHVKDLYNNYVGIAVTEWLQDSLGRSPTFADILTIMPLVSKYGILADRGNNPKGDIGILYALEASAAGGLAHGLVDKSIRKFLDGHANEIHKSQIKGDAASRLIQQSQWQMAAPNPSPKSALVMSLCPSTPRLMVGGGLWCLSA